MADKNKSMQVQQQQLVEQEGSERTRSRDTYIPRADIYETEDSIYITLDMPGANQNQIDVTLEGYQGAATDKAWLGIWRPGASPPYWHYLEASQQTTDYSYSGSITSSISEYLDSRFPPLFKVSLPSALSGSFAPTARRR